MFRFSSSNRSKKRRLNPTSPKRGSATDRTPRLFENIRVYIHPYTVNSSRRKVLHNLIRKNGGTFTLVPDSHMTHVLVDEGISSGKLCRSLGWTTFPPHVYVLMVGWLSASVRANHCLNPADYEIPCTHRPTFVSEPRDVQSQSAVAMTGSEHNEGTFSDSPSSSGQLSVHSDDADVEVTNFDYVDEEGSTYDDGKYDEETSCDDEWLRIPPTIPFNACGVTDTSSTLPLCPSSSQSCFDSSQIKTASSPLSNEKPDVAAPPTRPDTLAARLSRVRVRRIPDHLRVPGGQTVIVDLNKDNYPQPSTQDNVALSDAKKNDEKSAKTVVNGTFINSVDEKIPGSINTASKTRSPSLLSGFGTEQVKYVNKNSQSMHKCQSSTPTNYLNKHTPSSEFILISKENEKPSADFASEVLAGEMKDVKSVTDFPCDQQFDAESDKEVHQVVNMIVESVSEVAVNEKIIKESVDEISKREMIIGESNKDIFLKENISDSVTDILHRVVENVSKDVLYDTISSSPIRIVKVETVDDNIMNVSTDETAVTEDMKILNVQSMTEKVTGISQDETLMENVKISSEAETMTTDSVNQAPQEENICVEYMEVDCTAAELPVPQSSQLPIISDVSPYPVRLFCSTNFESSLLENFSNDNSKLESVECITSEINYSDRIQNSCSSEKNSLLHAGNIAPASVSNTSVSTSNANFASEATNQLRSCSGPDVTAPNLFFPFPVPSSSHSRSSSNSRLTGQRSDTCHYYPNSPNIQVIKTLQILYESFKRSDDKWRVHTYEKAIIALGKYRKAIESLEEIQSLNGMSKKIAKKIWEIVQTGHLKEIDEFCVKRWEETRKTFTKAWGISPSMARKLFKEGFCTIYDLQTKSDLSRAHRVGLRYYEDFKSKMSKKEATMILSTVLQIIFEKYPCVQCDACSSLRRNKKTCGHVSILVTLPKGCENDHQMLPDVVAKLHQLGFLIDDLVRHEENGAQTKYVGILKLGNSFKHRRLDITVCTQEEHACAILYLTGSSYFNRAIQHWAVKREMVLDEHSLRIRLLNANGGTEAVTKLHTPDEATIFKFLQLPYRSPEQRDRFIM